MTSPDTSPTPRRTASPSKPSSTPTSTPGAVGRPDLLASIGVTADGLGRTACSTRPPGTCATPSTCPPTAASPNRPAWSSGPRTGHRRHRAPGPRGGDRHPARPHRLRQGRRLPARARRRLPALAFPALADDLEQAGRPLVLHCAGGHRSSVAAGLLRRMNRSDVSDLLGGYGAWLTLPTPAGV
ncbi:rhodanese-like domain-containing protein [Streptomyces sp. NPDC001388]|uniref:rhodanese-like domain-containing protein n=1 Tax=Streptomyces sp. NPDC001388 TaxID=3364568 RepID=UPI003695ADDD